MSKNIEILIAFFFRLDSIEDVEVTFRLTIKKRFLTVHFISVCNDLQKQVSYLKTT